MSRSSIESGLAMSVILISLSPALSGCGGVKYYPVSGEVTLDGRALPEATVSFMPEDDLGTPALGKTDSQGNYTLQQTRNIGGTAAGVYRVRITTFFEGIPDIEPPMPARPEKVPVKYNLQSELVREVKPGENVFDFPLDSQGEIFQPSPDK